MRRPKDFFRSFFGLDTLGEEDPICVERTRAATYIQGRYLTFTVGYPRLRAEEPTRYVFAVYYRNLGAPLVPSGSRQPCYKLVAVDRDGDGIEELSPDSSTGACTT